MRPDVTLRLAGTAYTGWQAVQISTGLEQLAGTFTLDLTDKWALDSTAAQIREGDACQVLVAGQPVITGWVDEVAPEYDGESHNLRVRGRDRTGDLVDCAAIHANQEWVGRTLDQIARNALAPFGMSVRVDTNVGAPFRYAHADPGETVHELLERAARFRGVLLVSDGATGELALTRAGSRRAAGALVLGENILAGQATRSQRDRYSQYRVLGQQREDEGLSPKLAATASAEVRDTGVARYRPTIVTADEAASISECQTRAAFERGKAVAQGQRATLTVVGWTDYADAVWAPNSLVAVRDRWLGLDGDYLIAGVDFQIDDQGGRISRITVVPPGAYDLLAEKETDPAGASKVGAGGSSNTGVVFGSALTLPAEEGV